MAYTDMARSHVIECARRAFELPDVRVDSDGDVPMRWGTAAYYLTVRSDGSRVMAWSPAVTQVKSTAGLLRELNDVNAGLIIGRAFWRREQVVVEGTLSIPELTPELLLELCTEVGETAHTVGAMLSAVYGGSVFFPEDDTCSECGQ